MIEFLKGVLWALSVTVAYVGTIWFIVVTATVAVGFPLTRWGRTKGWFLNLGSKEFVKWWMKLFLPPFIATVVALCIIFALGGCAGLSDPAKPRNETEQFPARNQDPRVGLVVNNGTAPMNLYIYDQANRLVEQVYLSGAERHIVSPNGQPYPQYWMRRLEQGCYRIESWPFFKAIRWTPLPIEVLVKLPTQTYSVCIGNNPTAYYYRGAHFGWLLQIGANIPDGATGLPLLQIMWPL